MMTFKGHIPWNKGKKLSDEINKKLEPTWFKKGHAPWNKGKEYPQISMSRKGESHPLYGKTPWNKGKTGIYTDKALRSNALKHKGRTPWNKGRPRPEIWGNRHPRWKGGSSFTPYCHKFNNALKEAVRDRDSRTCQLCGTKQNGEKLSVHHIHYDRENCHPDLITLCRSCNSKVNEKREHYELLFMNMLNERGLLLWKYRLEVI